MKIINPLMHGVAGRLHTYIFRIIMWNSFIPLYPLLFNHITQETGVRLQHKIGVIYFYNNYIDDELCMFNSIKIVHLKVNHSIVICESLIIFVLKN